MLRWVEWHRILWVPLVLDGTTSAEFGAGPVPAGVGLIAAGDAVNASFVSTFVSTVRISAGSAGVFICLAIVDEVSPASAFHALNGFCLLFLRPDSRVADVQPISYDEVGGVC